MIELFTNENGSWQLLAKQESDLDYLVFMNGRRFCLSCESPEKRMKSLLQAVHLIKSESNKEILIVVGNRRILI